LIVKPKNKTVVVGENTWMDCSTDRIIPVDWYKRMPDGGKILMYTLDEINYYLVPRFDVFPARQGRYDLQITDAQLVDEGTYECQDEAGLGESATAYLSVRENGFQQTTGTVLHCLKSCVFFAY